MKFTRDPRVKKLLDAAEKGNVAAVRRLLEEGADPNAILEDRMENALTIAIYYRQADVIRAMAGSKADFNGGWPHTPLSLGVRTQNLDLIRALVEAGADVDKPNSSGQSALQIAVQEGWVEVAAELVRLGADPNLVPQKKKHETVSNYSPMQWAAMEGNKKMLAALKSAAPGAKTDKKLLATQLCGAAAAGDLAEVKRLVEKEDVGVDARDARDATPLVSAAAAGKAKVVRFLLDRGADVNLVGGKRSDGHSPLIAAALSGNVDVVRLLVEAGADPHYAPPQFPDYDALAMAKEARQKKVVEYLLAVQKQRGGRGRKTDARAKRPTPRGVTTFDTNDAMLLVAAPVADVSKAFATRIGAKKRKENVLGEDVKLTGRCYVVWKLLDSPWTNVMKVRCANFKHWPDVADAAALSKSLKTRALYVANSDTGGCTRYALFDHGEPVEVFDYSSGADGTDAASAVARYAKIFGADLTPLANVSVGDGKFFASTSRKLDVVRIKNDLDFVDDYVKRQEAFVPFGFDDEWGEAGETAELTLEGLGPDDVERLDFIAAR